MKRSFRIALCAIVTAAVSAPVLLHAQGQNAPAQNAQGQNAPAPAAPGAAAAAPATTQAGRTPQQIGVDLQAAGMKLSQSMDNGAALRTPEGRKKAAPVVAAEAPKIIALLNELVSVEPRAKEMAATNIAELHVLQLAMDDPAAVAENAKAAGGTDVAANQAKAMRAAADYVKAAGDAAGQDKAIDAFDVALKSAKDDAVTMQLLGYFMQTEAASPAVTQHLLKVAKTDGGPMGEQMASQLEAQQKLATLENKPLEIKGEKLGGGTLSTADWKGKVILVDFWATWCGPCRAELPRVKKIYQDYHDKGLEILGVSCDNSADDLKKFLDENKDMPWPQLFDASKPGWHALATQYGVMGIPTMFLIDKTGVVRTVEARETMETMIPKLLAEK
jgi:thiol-disulfide isomerase/thioredoxin